jgi:hypothetical protein
MNSALVRWTGVFLFAVLAPVVLPGQTNCEEGDAALNPVPPQGMTVPEIIQKFAAKESAFREARESYTYTQDVTVQTLNGTTVDGEYRLVSNISYDGRGGRVETVTFAPRNTLVRIAMTREDLDDIRNRLPFVLATEDLPRYDVVYAGQQHVDEIDTYVFDMAPKTTEAGKRYFQGRIWVDSRDLEIVKTCGKNGPDATRKGGKKPDLSQENLTPRFVTYREQIDREYWFPTYIRADDILHFARSDVHVREIIKYTNYKRFDSKDQKPQ